MDIKICTKESFAVIGREGSTLDGKNFIQKLWDDVDSHFNEISDLALKDINGNIVGRWGLTSDFNHNLKPWEENYRRGLYLAGVECNIDADAPYGWTKWIIPSYEYIYVEIENKDTFIKTIFYLEENNIPLIGGVNKYYSPITKKDYLFFPIKKID